MDVLQASLHHFSTTAFKQTEAVPFRTKAQEAMQKQLFAENEELKKQLIAQHQKMYKMQGQIKQMRRELKKASE